MHNNDVSIIRIVLLCHKQYQ